MPASPRPLVTVVIPTRDRPEFLPQAARSVFEQTYADWELVVVDNASKIPAERVLGGRGQKDVRFIRNERNLDAAGARNAGVKAARGTLVAFLDDDDIFDPGYLAQAVEAFSAHPGLGLFRCQIRDLDVATGRLRHFYQLVPGFNGVRELFDWGVASASGFMVPKEAYLAAGGMDEELAIHEDFDFCLRMAERWPCFTSQETLVTKRAHPGGVTHDRYRVFSESLAFYRKLLRRPPRGISRRAIREKLAFSHQGMLSYLMISDSGLSRALPRSAQALLFWLTTPGVWRHSAGLPRRSIRALAFGAGATLLGRGCPGASQFFYSLAQPKAPVLEAAHE